MGLLKSLVVGGILSLYDENRPRKYKTGSESKAHKEVRKQRRKKNKAVRASRRRNRGK